MLSEVARVLSSDNQHVWLERQDINKCSGCSANTVCGQGLLANLRAQRSHVNLKLTNTRLKEFSSGDQVLLLMDERNILSLSALFYLLPLAIMLCFMLFAVVMDFGEPSVIFSTFSGLLLGIFALRAISRQHGYKVKFQPTIQLQ